MKSDTTTPKTMTLVAAVAWSGLSRSSLYRAAGEGRLRMVKAGRSTLVDTASLAALLESLPTAQIAPPRSTDRVT